MQNNETTAIQTYFDQLSDDIKQKINDICSAQETPTEADAKAYYDYIFDVAAPALGDDLIAEPMRYIISAVNGLRASDLQALIGEAFDSELFKAFVANEGRAALLAERQIAPDQVVYDLPRPAMRTLLQQIMGEAAYHACASDVGYHLLNHCEEGDALRRLQTMHLLLDGGETVAAAEYLSQAEGESLRLAILTMGHGLKDGPQYVKQTILDMPLVESENVNITKILMLMLCDSLPVISNLDSVSQMISSLHDIIGQLIAQGGHDDISVLLGMAKLRMAQNARLKGQRAQQQSQQATDEDAKKSTAEQAQMAEGEAQQHFIAALNYLMPPLQQADPATISEEQIRQYWICLKICQEMAQPKAMSIIFEAMVPVETAKQMTREVLDQYIDMCKTYFQMPEKLQEQFTNYTDATIALLEAFLKDEVEKENNVDNEDKKNFDHQMMMANYYQTLGELQDLMKRDMQSYDAYTEAQIRQMRLLGALQRHDKEQGIPMSQQQLLVRLTLSVSNHMLGRHYRKQGKTQHDLGILLRANMDLANDCFRAYPHDSRVLHFICNAALELGDYQHRSKGLLAECNTYQNVISQFRILGETQISQQICVDMAMLHTKCGQVQATNEVRRFKDGKANLSMALRLWQTLAQTTGNPEFKKNVETVEQILKNLK